MTRRPLSFGGDERGQVETFPLWPWVAVGIVVLAIALNEAVTVSRVAVPAHPNPIQMVAWTPATIALAAVLFLVPAAFQAGRLAQRQADDTD